MMSTPPQMALDPDLIKNVNDLLAKKVEGYAIAEIEKEYFGVYGLNVYPEKYGLKTWGDILVHPQMKKFVEIYNFGLSARIRANPLPSTPSLSHNFSLNETHSFTHNRSLTAVSSADGQGMSPNQGLIQQIYSSAPPQPPQFTQQQQHNYYSTTPPHQPPVHNLSQPQSDPQIQQQGQILHQQYFQQHTGNSGMMSQQPQQTPFLVGQRMSQNHGLIQQIPSSAPHPPQFSQQQQHQHYSTPPHQPPNHYGSQPQRMIRIRGDSPMNSAPNLQELKLGFITFDMLENALKTLMRGVSPAIIESLIEQLALDVQMNEPNHQLRAKLAEVSELSSVTNHISTVIEEWLLEREKLAKQMSDFEMRMRDLILKNCRGQGMSPNQGLIQQIYSSAPPQPPQFTQQQQHNYYSTTPPHQPPVHNLSQPQSDPQIQQQGQILHQQYFQQHTGNSGMMSQQPQQTPFLVGQRMSQNHGLIQQIPSSAPHPPQFSQQQQHQHYSTPPHQPPNHYGSQPQSTQRSHGKIIKPLHYDEEIEGLVGFIKCESMTDIILFSLDDISPSGIILAEGDSVSFIVKTGHKTSLKATDIRKDEGFQGNVDEIISQNLELSGMGISEATILFSNVTLLENSIEESDTEELVQTYFESPARRPPPQLIVHPSPRTQNQTATDETKRNKEIEAANSSNKGDGSAILKKVKISKNKFLVRSNSQKSSSSDSSTKRRIEYSNTIRRAHRVGISQIEPLNGNRGGQGREKIHDAELATKTFVIEANPKIPTPAESNDNDNGDKRDESTYPMPFGIPIKLSEEAQLALKKSRSMGWKWPINPSEIGNDHPREFSETGELLCFCGGSLANLERKKVSTFGRVGTLHATCYKSIDEILKGMGPNDNQSTIIKQYEEAQSKNNLQSLSFHTRKIYNFIRKREELNRSLLDLDFLKKVKKFRI